MDPIQYENLLRQRSVEIRQERNDLARGIKRQNLVHNTIAVILGTIGLFCFGLIVFVMMRDMFQLFK